MHSLLVPYFVATHGQPMGNPYTNTLCQIIYSSNRGRDLHQPNCTCRRRTLSSRHHSCRTATRCPWCCCTATRSPSGYRCRYCCCRCSQTFSHFVRVSSLDTPFLLHLSVALHSSCHAPSRKLRVNRHTDSTQVASFNRNWSICLLTR